MKELNNFYGKNHSKGKKKNEGGDAIQRAPDCPLFVPLETISIICHSQSSTPSVSCPLGDTVVDLNFFFSTESSRDNFFFVFSAARRRSSFGEFLNYLKNKVLKKKII